MQEMKKFGEPRSNLGDMNIDISKGSTISEYYVKTINENGLSQKNWAQRMKRKAQRPQLLMWYTTVSFTQSMGLSSKRL